jgi:hypothetical protein
MFHVTISAAQPRKGDGGRVASGFKQKENEARGLVFLMV